MERTGRGVRNLTPICVQYNRVGQAAAMELPDTLHNRRPRSWWRRAPRTTPQGVSE